jgi:hypothetical protein
VQKEEWIDGLKGELPQIVMWPNHNKIYHVGYLKQLWTLTYIIYDALAEFKMDLFRRYGKLPESKTTQNPRSTF